MPRDGAPIGVIMVARVAPGPFSDNEVELLKTFADQAVIAIENTRLFEAEQASKRELQKSLEYQTAISSVLAVISRSPTDVQPVLDTIARIASNLCSANDVVISLREDDQLRMAARYGPIPIDINVRRPIGRNWVSGRAVTDRQPVHVPDLLHAGHEFQLGRQIAERFGHRTTLGIPLLRGREAIGCLLLRRNIVQPFTDKQIELLKTFADQAVIAIENTRLFEAVRERTCELSEALEQRTATSEVLSVISSSPRELQPVFEVALRNAIRICGAKFGQLFLFDGNEFRIVATRDIPHAWAEFLRRQPSIPANPKVPLGRVAATKQVVHIVESRRTKRT
jgi:GAF domain-containing protein